MAGSGRTSLNETADIIILGATTAGLLTALHLSPRPVTVITQALSDDRRPALAHQPSVSPEDAPNIVDPAQLQPTSTTAATLSDARIAALVAAEASAASSALHILGLPSAALTGHDEIHRWQALRNAARITPSITLVEGFTPNELTTTGDGPSKRISGLYLSNASDPAARYHVRDPIAVILATGGASALFASTTNHDSALGQGIAIGARAGAIVADAEFVHFHPASPASSTNEAPAEPAAHIHLGGLRTDENGRTNIIGLWAIGEVAATGLHGDVLHPLGLYTETLVTAARCATDLSTSLPIRIRQPSANVIRERTDHLADFGARAAGIAMIRDTMSRHVGPTRTDAGLRQALATLADIALAGAGDPVIENAVLTARFITEAALRRRETRGTHVRADFPEPDPAHAKRRTMTRAGLDLRASLASGELLTEIASAGSTLH